MKPVTFFLVLYTLALMCLSSNAIAAIKGCQSTCAGIPQGKCSCVSIEGFTCCGKRVAPASSRIATTPRIKGCQSTCAGIPKGKCSCVSIEGYTCCGRRVTRLTTKPKTRARQKAKTTIGY